MVKVRLDPIVRAPIAPLEKAYGICPERFVTARLVVVAWVEVELVAVKFCRVVEPLNNAFVKVARSEVRLPMMPVLARRSVVLALLEMKRSVAVAFCKVEEAVARKLEV